MSLADDLEWWRANRRSPTDPATLHALLGRLQAWKADHDRDRAGQPGPFLKMVWDAVFGDEDSQVTEAIAEVQAALGEG